MKYWRQMILYVWSGVLYLPPGPRSGYHTGGVAGKFESPAYSERSSASIMAAAIGDQHLQLKEQLWLAQWVYQMVPPPSIGCCHLQLEEQFSLAEPMTILEEPFASYLKCVTPPRHLWGRPWAQIGTKTVTELTRRHTLNAAQLYTAHANQCTSVSTDLDVFQAAPPVPTNTF